VNDLTSLALLGWAATMLTTFTAVLFVGWVRARRKRAMAA